MTGSLIDRVFRIIELLAANAAGRGVAAIAEEIDIPKSAAHRLLGEMIRLGYVRQEGDTGRYLLTTKLLSLGFSYLSSSGVLDVAQPILDRLARSSGELVRLAVVDGNELTWVAKAQGARSGLRYDPEMGAHPTLFCTSTGLAWLATFDDETALQIAGTQGFGRLDEHGPNAPRTISTLLRVLKQTRERGYAQVRESAAVGTSAMAAAVQHPRMGRAIGTVSIAGPTIRLTDARMKELAPALCAAALELSQTSIGSDFLAEVSRSTDVGRPLCRRMP